MMAVDVSVGDLSLNEVGSASAFVAAQSGGLVSPKATVLGPNGDLFVVSDGNDSVVRYNASTGQFLGTFVASGAGGWMCLTASHSVPMEIFM